MCRGSFVFMLIKRARVRESAGLYARAMRTTVRECTRMFAIFCEYSSLFTPSTIHSRALVLLIVDDANVMFWSS